MFEEFEASGQVEERKKRKKVEKRKKREKKHYYYYLWEVEKGKEEIEPQKWYEKGKN